HLPVQPTPPTPIYTPPLHDAVPISSSGSPMSSIRACPAERTSTTTGSSAKTNRGSCRSRRGRTGRSEKPLASSTSSAAAARPAEIGRHTSELQSPYDLVCRLLLEKK